VTRHAYGARPTVEGAKSLDIRQLQRTGCLRPRSSSQSWNWYLDGECTGSIGFHVDDSAIVLVYRYRPDKAPGWQEVRQRVSITWTACAFGGSRPWFLCGCGRRVAVLYGYQQLFKCRHCYGLVYASQSEGSGDRALRRVRKIRTRLGGSPSLLDPLPEKPRGMHWSTYERLRSKAATAEYRSTVLLMAHLSRRLTS
jgi:hypothetical protein